MTVVVTIDTADAVPGAAPYKVSAITGHQTATVTINVTGTGPVRAYKLKRGGSAITNGVELADLGAVCGLAICGPLTKSAAITTPCSFIEPVPYTDLGGGADGAYSLNLYVYNGAVYE